MVVDRLNDMVVFRLLMTWSYNGKFNSAKLDRNFQRRSTRDAVTITVFIRNQACLNFIFNFYSGLLD